MKVCLIHLPGSILIQARAESDDDADLIGDLNATIEPGQEFLGHSYADLVALGEGEQTITEKETA